MDGVPTVAVVGAGRMGGAMVGTLRRAGVEVLVCNRTRAKAEPGLAQHRQPEDLSDRETCQEYREQGE